MARRAELDTFVAWLTGTAAQRVLDGGTGRTFRHRHAWCWRVEPVIPVSGQVFDEVQLDGIYLNGGWCALIAIAGGHVIGLQWCDQEKQASWAALLERLPAPRVVVTDGQRGILAALKACWPGAMLQRCLVHVQRNIRTHLTMSPRTDAGRALRALSLQLTRIRSRDHAAAWTARLHDWHQVYGPLTRQRTWARDVPATAIPAEQAGKTWWYTHLRLRRAYRLLERLTREGSLFTYLDARFDGLGISSTTNMIEGGVNSQLRDLLKRHRGMHPDHQKRLVEWWCYLHCERPATPGSLARPEHWNPQPPRPVTDDEPVGPAAYDTATSPEEGLWTRKGWAGRTN